MQTRDQQYASDIYKRVSRIKGTGHASGYGSMAHKLPILIHTSGLVQALAFASTRPGEGPKHLLRDLSRTILGESAETETLLREARGDRNDLTSDLQAYIYLTRRVLAALLWYKRYAQSILGVEQGQDEEAGEQEQGEK